MAFMTKKCCARCKRPYGFGCGNHDCDCHDLRWPGEVLETSDDLQDMNA